MFPGGRYEPRIFGDRGGWDLQPASPSAPSVNPIVTNRIPFIAPTPFGRFHPALAASLIRPLQSRLMV